MKKKTRRKGGPTRGFLWLFFVKNKVRGAVRKNAKGENCSPGEKVEPIIK